MVISAYAYTNKGGREHNEDSLRFSVEGDRGVFVLADGLGGHQCGEVASALAVDTLFEGCRSAAVLDEAGLAALMQQANTCILEAQSQPEQAEMKTTAVCLCTLGGQALWSHIGDSRLYHLRGSDLRGRTKDHSVTYMRYLGGEIGYMDIYHDDDRSSLLRVLGKQPCHPEQGGAAIEAGDAFLLCSDGFWEYVYDEELLIDWLKSGSPAQWAQHMLLRHIRRAGAGNDNFSLIAVYVEEA